jgi:hypothetical protein
MCAEPSEPQKPKDSFSHFVPDEKGRTKGLSKILPSKFLRSRIVPGIARGALERLRKCADPPPLADRPSDRLAKFAVIGEMLATAAPPLSNCLKSMMDYCETAKERLQNAQSPAQEIAFFRKKAEMAFRLIQIIEDLK